MPLVMPADYNKFSQSHPIYRGSGIHKLRTKFGEAKIKNVNNKHPIYRNSKSGGSFNDIIAGATKIFSAIQDNKDIIQSGMSTASSIAKAVESVSNVVKTSKDAEAIAIRNNKKAKKQQNSDEKFTPEQEAKMRSLGFIGNGFEKL